MKVRRIQPKEIVVFAQQDSNGDSGYAGVEGGRMVAARRQSGYCSSQLQAQYSRRARRADGLHSIKGKIKAVVMVASYRAAAKFIERTRELYCRRWTPTCHSSETRRWPMS